MKNKKILALCIAGVGIGSVGVAKADGTITFKGVIQAPACTIAVGEGSGNTTTIDFETLSSGLFATVGQSSQPKQFDIVLSDCSSANNPEIQFMAAPTDQGSELFKTDVAGVGIRINKATGTQTVFRPNVRTSHDAWADLSDEGPHSAAFAARLVSYAPNEGTPTRVGEIETVVNFSITYS